jgi:hypothetical protein
MEGSLPLDVAARLAELDTEFGARPPRTSWGPTVTRHVGPNSPLTSEQLEAMTDDAIVDYLQGWRSPEGEWFAPTPEGLGRQLAVLVQRQPERIAGLGARLLELAPTYIRHILHGWREAISKSGARVEWESVLRLVAFVSEQLDAGDTRDAFDEDVDWRGAQQAAASLLEMALRLPLESAPGVDLRAEIWSAIARLALSPDPSPSRERASGMDAEMTSINSVRPYAISAVVMYLSWLAQTGQVSRGGALEDTAPEAWHLLDRHLDPRVDPSLAVRSALGRDFRFLASVSPEWARTRAERLFGPGANDADAHRGDAAWAAYVRFTTPSPQLLELLGAIYRERLLRSVPETAPSRESSEAITAEHALRLYLDGVIGLGTDDGLLEAFFTNSSPTLRADVLGHFGWLLSRYPNALSEDEVARLQALWEWRRGVVEDGQDSAELAGFGWWFRSGKIAIDWAAAQLAFAVSRGADFDSPSSLVELLGEHALEVTADALTVLEAVIRGREQWEVQWVGGESAPVIAAGLDSDDAALRARADRLLNELGEMGLVVLRAQVEALRTRDEEGTDEPQSEANEG